MCEPCARTASLAAIAVVLASACGGRDRAAEDAGAREPDALVRADDAGERDAGGEGDAAVAVGGWRSETALPEAIQEITGAVHRGRLWIAGGFDASTSVSRAVRSLDPATGTWTEEPELPAPRHHAMLVSTGDDLYLLGGMETARFEPLDTAWVLRAGATEWADVAPLPEDRGAGVAAEVGDRIVIAAGNATRGGLASSTLRYDPIADRWEIGAAIPAPREHVAGFAHAGELWVIAGRRNSLSTNTTSVDVYDPIADAWRTGPAIPTARGGHGAAVLDGRAYVIGGEQPDRALDAVEVLDLASGTWSASSPVPTPRHGHVVLAAAGRVWVIGGGDAPIFAAVDVVESYAP